VSADANADSSKVVPETAPNRRARSAPARYEIRLRDHIDFAWSEHFEGMSISHEGEDVTVLAGVVADQAALQGLLARVFDLGIPLLSLQRLEVSALPAESRSSGSS
jgi:hypothetical protein